VILVSSLITLLIGVIVVTLGRKPDPVQAGPQPDIDTQEPAVTPVTESKS
jgi:hypothetical protein